MSNLLPCPFCGKKAMVKRIWMPTKEKGVRIRYTTVKCSNGYCSVKPETKPKRIPADAYYAWNRRADV